MNSPLRCDLHDYLEIACMFKYKVELTVESGVKYVGTAMTIKVDKLKQEVLLIRTEANKRELAIPTRQLRSLLVLTENARFQNVQFS